MLERHGEVAIGENDEDGAGDPREERPDVELLERAEEAGEALEPGVRKVRDEGAPGGRFRRRAQPATPGENAKAEMRS